MQKRRAERQIGELLIEVWTIMLGESINSVAIQVNIPGYGSTRFDPTEITNQQLVLDEVGKHYPLPDEEKENINQAIIEMIAEVTKQ